MSISMMKKSQESGKQRMREREVYDKYGKR